MFCMNWEVKFNWGFGGHCDPLNGFSGGVVGKILLKIYNILLNTNLIWTLGNNEIKTFYLLYLLQFKMCSV